LPAASAEVAVKQPSHVLVGLKSPEIAQSLVEYACRLAARDASILLVHVFELPDVTPLDAEVPELEKAAEEMLVNAERTAVACGARARRLFVHAHNAGPALVELLKEEKIELAVLGYHHRKTLGEILLGTTAQHLIHHAPCELLISVLPRDRK
jgi:nucleotide-binding universal stress UspA family protein